MITEEERENERILFQSEREKYPKLFERDPMLEDRDTLEWLGISLGGEEKPIGYLRLMPQDFIVEEISKDGILHSVQTQTEPEASITNSENSGKTIFADLVKIGISTLDAKAQLAGLLQIPEKNIGFAGIKDRLSLSSQAISIRGLESLGKMGDSANKDNFFLKNMRWGTGVIENGDLKGNCFTITVRMPEELRDAGINRLKNTTEKINNEGFWNFFYTQRFGTPRLISHWLGLLLLKRKYEDVIRTFLTHTAPNELPYFQNIRSQIDKIWGDWAEIERNLSRFPYHFHIELSFIRHLINKPEDFIGALRTVPDQVRLWFYAYDSYLFNRKLSDHIKENNVPESLPLISSFNPKDWRPYESYLRTDRLHLPSGAYKDFPFIQVRSRHINTRQNIDLHGSYFDGRIAVLSFSIPKAVYATTFLMNMFTLISGLPVVEGISCKSIDSKELLNTGSLKKTLKRFDFVIKQRTEDLKNQGLDLLI